MPLLFHSCENWIAVLRKAPGMFQWKSGPKTSSFLAGANSVFLVLKSPPICSETSA
jgi:hypothetical protein